MEVGVLLKDFEKHGVETFSSIANNDAPALAEEYTRRGLHL